MKFTPERISTLQPDEIFVFGSNLKGMHGGGAARLAHARFGAVWGQGTGLQGQSYAIPTMHGGVEAIRPYVDEFTAFARECDQNTFLVTRIGCGIAGFKPAEMAPLFADAYPLYNVRLPRDFVEVICSPQFTASTASDPLASYTIADVVADYCAIVLRFRPYLAENPELLKEHVTEHAATAPHAIFTPVKEMFAALDEASPEGLTRFATEASARLSHSYPYYTPYLRYTLLHGIDEGRRLLGTGRTFTADTLREAILGHLSSPEFVETTTHALSALCTLM